MIEILNTDGNYPMLLINIYNIKNTPLINNLSEFIQTNSQQRKYGKIAIVGDFNLHYPLWNPAEYQRHDTEAEDLIALMAANALDLILPPGTITFPRSKTTIDLVLGNTKMEQSVLKCKIARNHDHGSDHLPIITTFTTSLNHTSNTQTPAYNFEKTNWDLLKVKLQANLSRITYTHTPSPASVDQLAEEIINALAVAIAHSTPRKKICPFSKRWWNEKLTEARREANKLRNKYRRRNRKRMEGKG